MMKTYNNQLRKTSRLLLTHLDGAYRKRSVYNQQEKFDDCMKGLEEFGINGFDMKFIENMVMDYVKEIDPELKNKPLRLTLSIRQRIGRLLRRCKNLGIVANSRAYFGTDYIIKK